MKEQIYLNFKSIIINTLTTYWYLWLALICLTIIKTIMKSNSFKGLKGELTVILMQWCYLDKKIYHISNNVYFDKNKVGSIQIDHIIVSIYGIFVTETKNIQGLIKGKDYEYNWYQILPNKVKPFQNPLKQNEYHIKFLSNFLSLPENKFHSIIKFTNYNCKFENKMPDNVLLKGYIKYIKNKTKKILTEKEAINIFEKIKVYRKHNNLKTKREHIKYVKNINEKLKVKIPNPHKSDISINLLNQILKKK